MSEDFVYDKEKLSFKQIVLGHLNKILDISTREFRGGYYVKNYAGSIIKEEYVPDTRACYIQAVESLASILFPYFDEKIEEKYKELIKEINYTTQGFGKEHKKKFQEKHGEGNTSSKDVKATLIYHKLMKAKELFLELNRLLHRQDYLKGAIYDEE